MVQVPGKYEIGGFIGGGYLLETKTVPNFRVALSIEGVNGRFSCSLLVFLGDVKVWDSGHYSRFYVTGKCLLEFTMDGDLRLKGPNETLGWKTGTSGQGVKTLQIQNTGNLVLMDEFNNVKWQSFNFPTDVMLRGQQLDVATRLTSSRINSSMFYSFEIENNKVAFEGFSGDFCSDKRAEMLEIDNVSSVLKGAPQTVNISRDTCSSLCLQDCKCAAALYFRNASVEAAECYLYRLVLGLKQVDKGSGFSYMVKVPKGIGRNHEKHNLKRWILLAVGVFDGLIIMTLVGGFVYWLIKRRNRGLRSEGRNS
ncbi:hypothetical protein TSUD_178390 [Trifolium subterraneum]|uniref:Bulb-type lectin domain-containing protein n=1 Tax=Trifolium subterraneum TaxID=3900 RepID=A0A2Z6M5F5_TRISU|nr:hypothetical protein TSUD_178390 [Trifolium subterraneum]